MRIHRLRLANYRGIREREVTFAPTGVTVVQGPNEIGKTSLAEALDLLLDHYDDTQRAAVRAVKPVDRDAGAEIEAELSTGPYRFTYAKRFHRDRSTTLTVHEPAPVQKTGREAHDAVRAMLAETIDEALWQAQRLTQGSGVEQADLRDQTALARALDQVATVPTAREREVGLYDRVVEEYRRYHTATGRPSSAVKDAVAAHEAACHDAELARKQLVEVEADVERCASLARDLADCRARAEAHQQRLPELEQAWRELAGRLEEVERLRLAAELADSALATARAAAETRGALADEVAAAERSAAEQQAEAERVDARASATEQARVDADAHARESRRALRSARDAAAHARRTCERQRDRLDLTLMAERLERVTAAQQQAAEAEAVVDACRVDDALLERIEAAHLQVLQAEARLDGDRAVMEIEALGDVDIDVDGQRRTLRERDTDTVAVTAATEVAVPGVVAVRVRPGGGVRALAGAVSEASKLLASGLAEGEVGDVGQARAAHRRRAEAERSRADAQAALRRDLRDLTPELLADKVRRLRDRLGEPGDEEDVDLDAARHAVEQADAAVETRAERAERAEHTLARATADAEDARNARARLSALREAATATLEERRSALEMARRQASDEHLDACVAAASADAAAARGAYDAAARELAAADPDAVKAALDNARAVSARDAGEIRALEDELRETRARLEVRGEEGLAERLAAAETQVRHTGQVREAIQGRAAAARLLYETVQRHRDEARRAYVAPFCDKVTALARTVFGPDVSVELDEDLAITQRTLGGVTVPFADLSAGAREQLAVIARLACAAITSDDGGVPLILDDALGYSDPRRLEALGAVFAMAAADAQVIVLTCMPERYRHIGSARVVRLD